jgi:hypothetical protein
MLIETLGIHAPGGWIGGIEISAGEVQWGFFSDLNYTAAYLLCLAAEIEKRHRVPAMDCAIATAAVVAAVVAAVGHKQPVADMN